MKKISLVILLILPGIAQGKWLPFVDDSTKALVPEIKIIKDDPSGITLEANIFGADVDELQVKGAETFQLLSIPGHKYRFTQEVGRPKLPVIQVMLAIPDDVEIDILLPISDSQLLTSYLIYPVPKQVIKTTKEGYQYVAEEFTIDEEFYSRNIWYPELRIPCKIAATGYIRDQRILRLEIYPIQFNPVKKQLKAYSNIKIELKYLRKKGILASPKQPKMAAPFVRVLKHTLLNYKPTTISRFLPHAKRIGTVSYIIDLKNPSNSADYLIITSPDFYNDEYLNRLARHRAEFNGFDVAVVQTTNIYNEFPPPPGTQTEDISIKNFLKYVYNTWSAPSMSDNHLGYVLLFGDGTENAPGYVSYHVGGGWGGISAACDTWYTYLNDEDDLTYGCHLQDIMLGRLPLQYGTEANVVVDKIIQFEKNPTPGVWRNRALLVDGVLFEWVSRDYIKDNILSPIGFDVTIINGDEGGVGEDVFNAINNGQLLVAYNGHGTIVGWGVQAGENVSFSYRHVDRLSNGGKLPIAFAVSCNTARFNDEWDSLGELLVKKENGGAIAYWGASTICGPYELWMKEAYDFMAENHPYTFCLGEMALNAYIQFVLWYEEFNLLGDPALTVSRVPPEQGKAELEIEPIDINFSPSSPKPNQLTKITANVHNYGDTEASSVTVHFFLENPDKGGLEIGSKTITNILAKGEKEIEINWEADVEVGEYNIYVVIDPDNAIQEASKDNNKTYKLIEVNFYQQGWPKYIPPMRTGPFSVGDIDGDGDLEIVSICGNRVIYVWHHDGNLAGGWSKKIEGNDYTIPILADIDADGRLEIIVNGEDKLYIWNAGANDISGFPKEGTNLTSPAIGDIDGDGDLEIVIGMNNKLYVFHHDGRLVEGNWPKEMNLSKQDFPIIADLDKDGKGEIIVGVERNLYVWHGNGEFMSGQWPILFPYGVGVGISGVGDFDGDGELEIIARTTDYNNPKLNFYTFKPDGSIAPGWPKILFEELNLYYTVLGDIDNDGDMELLATVYDTNSKLYKLYAFHHDGSLVTNWPKEGFRPFLANIDLDENLEIVTIKRGTITVLEDDGTPKINLFTKPGDCIVSPMVIADIDLDEDIEMICGGKEPEYGSPWRKIYIWDYEEKCKKGALEWAMENHNARRTNCYNTDIIHPAKIEDLQARDPTPYSIDLFWTATGDDYDIGTATLYFIRYATFTITLENWHLANKATFSATKSAGEQESFVIQELETNATYYFCIQAQDDGFNLSPLSNIASATIPTGPHITVEKIQDKQKVTQYSTVTYTIIYKNSGSTVLTDIVLTDTLPNGSVSTFIIGTLTPSEEGSITIDYYITEPASQTIVNIAEIEGDSEEGTVSSSSQAVVRVVGASSISLEKHGPSTALTLSTITYTLIYKNTGETTLYDVTIIDNGTYPIGTLTPSQEGSITIDYYIMEPSSSTITNIATIEGRSSICPDDIVSASSSITTHITGIPGISLNKSGPSPALTQSTITYKLTYKNTGTTRLYNVTIEDLLPDGSTKTYTIGTLTSLQEGSIFVDYYVEDPPSSTITNIATIKGNSICPDGTVSSFSSITTHIIGIPKIILTKEGPNISKTGTITYTITYENIGNDIANDVVIIEVLPEKTILETINNQQLATSYYVNGNWQEGFNENATKIRWIIPEVLPNQEGTISFTVRVKMQ
ncbi:TPA: hypothetical protein DCX16_06400 [bacterium]|nr:hypothetical protein [bacterium]